MFSRTFATLRQSSMRTQITRQAARTVSNNTSFLNGANANYIDTMHSQWQRDPTSVHASWQAYFSGQAFEEPPTLGKNSMQGQLDEIVTLLKSGGGARSVGSSGQSSTEAVKLSDLLAAYETIGHLVADIDPLNLQKEYKDIDTFSQKFRFPAQQLYRMLDYRTYGFTEADLEREFTVELSHKSSIIEQKKVWKLKDIIAAYKQAYCGKIGVEFSHIPETDVCDWIRTRFEGIQFYRMTDKEKVHLYDRLNWAHHYGTFLTQKFNTEKRFGLEGCDSFIPGLKVAIDACAENGASHFVIGMPHRGRLNVLINVVRKPLEVVFAELQGIKPTKSEEFAHKFADTGDVKYHLGTTYKRRQTLTDGTQKDVSITLLPNPSHLEAVNPVVMGRARAMQHTLGGNSTSRKEVVPIIIHGDAAMAGQGIVYEQLQMQSLDNYRVGGTIHVVVNNQVGFTTNPSKGRSGVYATDVGKSINAPVFHVNADSMEDVQRTFKFAAELRQKFQRDVIIDLIGYRKYGHNELDQPAFTQPLMYKVVQRMKPCRDIYREQLIKEGIPEAQLKAIEDTCNAKMEEAYAKSKTLAFNKEQWMTEEWAKIKENDKKFDFLHDTGYNVNAFNKIGADITKLPSDGGKFHPQIVKIFQAREKSIQEGKGIDWGTAEALAFATLIDQGYHVRLSGQDVERGTFSHRHAHVFYQDRDGHYCPINQLVQAEYHKEGRTFIASSSHLSEYAVLGFEYGYAMTLPNTLTLWEAQFGDFANGAQIMIDQFVTSGEAKWNVHNGLVMLLPHGFDGNGPEHSSARVERYLQLSDSADCPTSQSRRDVYEVCNIQVVNCTTAAQYFHVLRRQMLRSFRKPLIVIAPKKMLKMKEVCSNTEDFTTGTHFKRVLGETNAAVVPAKVRKVILCSGQVYYDLVAERDRLGKTDIAILRIEQLAPFPFNSLAHELKPYKDIPITWCQEEHKNQGPWSFVEPRLRNFLKQAGSKQTDIEYVGRNISASTATGYSKTHKEEFAALLQSAMV